MIRDNATVQKILLINLHVNMEYNGLHKMFFHQKSKGK